jgi:DNA topoisomerase I
MDTPKIDHQLQDKLDKEDLKYVHDKQPGYFRQKSGKKIEYYDLDGKRIKKGKVLDRIEALVIPPAWEHVWICPSPSGYLQATGFDEKGRKQYIYHADWTKISQQNKFSKLIDFGLHLPKIRGKVDYNLNRDTLDKRRILATIIWLLEHTFVRIGNEEYSRENNSFGLTTLRERHVEVSGSNIRFKFKGKSGVMHTVEISNPRIAKTIKKSIDLPGFEIFKFFDEDGERHIIDSEDVNNFLKEITGEEITAKDFRTWGGSIISADNLFALGEGENKTTIKKNINETIKKVASHLNNTVSVCRNYYVHPTVIHTYQKSILVPHFENYEKSKSTKPGLSWKEFALIKLLQKHPYSEARI